MELRYKSINQQKKITFLEERNISLENNLRRKQNDCIYLENRFARIELKFDADIAENRNLRKAIDDLNQKN